MLDLTFVGVLQLFEVEWVNDFKKLISFEHLVIPLDVALSLVKRVILSNPLFVLDPTAFLDHCLVGLLVDLEEVVVLSDLR